MLNINYNKIVGHTGSLPKDKIISGVDYNVHNLGSPDVTNDVLDSILQNNDETSLNKLYREIYLYDNISGPTVDIITSLPWSEFYFKDLSDSSVRKIFEDCVSELSVINLLQDISKSYLVLGKTIASLVFNRKKGIFTDTIIQDPDNCEIVPIPLRGYDPKINVIISKEIRDFARSKDPRDKEAIAELPADLKAKLMSGRSIPLEPLNTIYAQRGGIPGATNSMSYYTRVLPIWIIEKALMRGTILEAWRRQKSRLHVIVGDENWIPTDEQLRAITSMFIQSERDPLGTVITTRQGIDAQEIPPSPGSFWKLTDETANLSESKMKALGVNDALLSGDASYNTLEMAISIFNENLISFREYFTNNILRYRILLSLSKYHDIRKRKQHELDHRVRVESSSKSGIDLNSNLYNKIGTNSLILGSRNLSNAGDYIVPNIVWKKQLTAKSDEQYLNFLKEAEQVGIPINISMYAAATGVDLSEVISKFDEDVEARKKLKEHKDKLKKEGLTSGDDDGGGGMFGRTKNLNVVSS